MTPTRMPSTDHARHDRLVVVRYLDLDDDLLASEVSQARSLLASCPDCSALAVELQSITDATSRMALPTRPRDFRLTPAQAAELRPNVLRRFLVGAAGAFRFEFLRPLAGAAVAVGLLLAVVGALPSFQAGSASGELSAAGADTQRAAPTAGPASGSAAAGAAGTPENRDTASTAAPMQLGSLPAPAVSPGSPVAIGSATDKADATPLATGIEGQLLPTSATREPQPNVPPASDAITAFAPAATAKAGEPPSEGSGSDSALTVDANHPAGTISPLLILGVLLTSVGILVLLLTLAARRIGRSAG